jgi:hypothetical protein
LAWNAASLANKIVDFPDKNNRTNNGSKSSDCIIGSSTDLGATSQTNLDTPSLTRARYKGGLPEEDFSVASLLGYAAITVA